MASYEDAVRAYIERLRRLTPEEFAQALAEEIRKRNPDRAVIDAFESAELAERSLLAAESLYRQTSSILYRRREELRALTKKVPKNHPDYLELRKKTDATEWFQSQMYYQLRSLQLIVADIRQATGISPNAPNPRARAARELATRHSEEYLELVRKHQRIDAERRAARKAEKRAEQEQRQEP